MSGRSPARFAAPIALLAAALAIYYVGFAGKGGEQGTGSSTRPAAAATSGKAAAKPKAAGGAAKGKGGPRATTGRVYTVKAGDALSVIAEQTGVTIEELMRLNPGLDARTLQVGRRLRLSG